MSRRLKLSPLQRDILVMLEEAGAETVGTVVATLKPSHGEFTVQVDQLVTLDLIRRDRDSIVLTEKGKIALTS
jgi:predicted transcriptional regulator